MVNRTCIIGDIHGMLRELILLLDKVQLSKDDVLVLVGDLVDKGPDSAGVVRYLNELQQSGYNVVLVEGNHEEKHANYRRFIKKMGSVEGATSQMKGADKIAEITSKLSKDDVRFLDTAVIMHPIPEHNALVVHAGIPVTLETVPTAAQIAAGGNELRAFREVLRVRHVTGADQVRLTVEFNLGPVDLAEVEEVLTEEKIQSLFENHTTNKNPVVVINKKLRPKGSFIQLGKEKPGDPFWADLYDGRFGHVYFGHNPFPDASEPPRFAHATALDLGAVFGGNLAAAVLEVGKEPVFVTVKASQKFANGFWENAA